MKKKYLIMLSAIVGLTIAGCEVAEESAAKDSKIFAETGISNSKAYDSHVFGSVPWNQEVKRRRLSNTYYYSNAGGLDVVSYFYHKLL